MANLECMKKVREKVQAGLNKGYKMVVSPANSVDMPALPYNELHAMAQVKTPIKDYLEAVFTSGVTHHCIVGVSHMDQELLAVAEFLKLETFYIA